jgi:hypothetical protein
MGVAEMVCEVQDAYFEGRYRDVIEIAARIHERDAKEEDTYDILLASYLALGDYEGVVNASRAWVSLCEESLKQLLYLVEAAYMLDDVDTVKDASFKLAFLYQSSERDQVFLSGALLGCALALDCGLEFPSDAVEVQALIEGNEPLSFWLRLKLGEGDQKAPTYDESVNPQAADLVRCLLALHHFSKGDSDEAARQLQGSAVDATGLAARKLFAQKAELQPVMSRVHPLFRKRLSSSAK